MGIFMLLRKVQRCMESLANPLTIPFGVHERQSKRCLNLHLMPRIAVRRHPIDRLLHPCSAFQKKGHGQEWLRSCGRQSYGFEVVSIGTKAPFERGTDISKIVSHGVGCSFRELQIEEIDRVAFQHLNREARVPLGNGILLATGGQLLQSVGARRIKQPVARSPRAGPNLYQGFIYEISQSTRDLGPAYPHLLRHCERRLPREVPHENCDTSQEDSFDLRKMVVTPVQRCDERLMPWICGSSAELQEIEARTQSCHRVPDAKDSGPSGGKLDGECNAVKLAANLGNHGSFVVTERKVAAASTDTLGEQPCGRIGKHL